VPDLQSKSQIKFLNFDYRSPNGALSLEKPVSKPGAAYFSKTPPGTKQKSNQKSRGTFEKPIPNLT